MGYLDLNAVCVTLADGRPLLDEVSLRVGEGARMALIGPNGAGKTTLLRVVSGDLVADSGAVTGSGGLGVMRQFVARAEGESTVRDLLVSVAPAPVRAAAAEVSRTELLMMERDEEADQLAYAQALADWADVGGYEWETLWDVCTVAALGIPYERAQWRALATLSGGEQKRMALEALLRGPDEVLLLDEPDNFLDVPAKRWLEERLVECGKTILFVSHDRELLDKVATRIATLEPSAAGARLWVHPGGFATYHQARLDRNERLDELRRRWDEEHAKLRTLMLMYKQKAAYNSDMAARYQAAQTRLRRFEDAGPPEEVPVPQRLRMRLSGGRTAKRAVIAEQCELTDLMRPFDLEVWYGDRVAVLGSDGSGTSSRSRFGIRERFGSARGCGPGGSPRPMSTLACRGGRCWRSSTAATTTGPGDRARRRPGRWTATAWPVRVSSASRPCPAVSRRASRSSCSSCRARPCCSSTSRPTTSTSSRPRRWRRPSTPSTARSSR